MKFSTTTKILFHAVSFIQLYGIVKGWSNMGGFAGSMPFITKALLMPLLALYFFSATRLFQNNTLKFVYAALFFSWVGDILLTYRTELYFLSGIIAFLTAHIFYMRYYYKESGYKHFNLLKQKPFLVVPYALVVIFFVAKTYTKMDWFVIPIGIYGTILCVMSLMALNRFRNVASVSFVTTYIGSLLFVFSDFMIGWNIFAEPVANAGFIIMVTYIIGQYLIVEGLLKHLSLVHRSR